MKTDLEYQIKYMHLSFIAFCMLIVLVLSGRFFNVSIPNLKIWSNSNERKKLMFVRAIRTLATIAKKQAIFVS